MSLVKIWNYATESAQDFDEENGVYLYANEYQSSVSNTPRITYTTTVGYIPLIIILEDGTFVELVCKQSGSYYQLVPITNGGALVDEWKWIRNGSRNWNYIEVTKNAIINMSYMGSEHMRYTLPSPVKEVSFTRETSHYYKGDFKYNYVDDKAREMIEEVKMFKFPNATIIGEPTINNGQISGFTDESYLKFPFLVDFKNRPFEIQMEFTTGSNVTNQENIFDSDFGLAFAIRSGKFVIAVSSNGTSWNIGEGVGTYTVLPNTTYKVKLGWSGTQYTLSYSVDGGSTWNTDITKDSSESPFPKQIYIGVGQSDVTVLNHFSGIINLNYANLYISNELVWQGMDDVGLASRLATDLSNIDADGEEKIREFVGKELTLEEYSALPEEEKNNGTTYYVTDANVSCEVGTAGTIKPYMYSENEVVVGVYMGKPLYRKVIISNSPAVSTNSRLFYYSYHSIDKLLSFSLSTYFNPLSGYDNGIVLTNGSNPTDSNFVPPAGWSWAAPSNEKGFYINTGSVPSHTIKQIITTIEYTKTTDAEGSGNNLMPYSAVDASLPFRFGITEDGQYGYYKAGADTVTPFKSGDNYPIYIGNIRVDIPNVKCIIPLATSSKNTDILYDEDINNTYDCYIVLFAVSSMRGYTDYRASITSTTSIDYTLEEELIDATDSQYITKHGLVIQNTSTYMTVRVYKLDMKENNNNNLITGYDSYGTSRKFIYYLPKGE